MRHSEPSTYSDGETQPLKRWFRDSYSREFLSHRGKSAFELASMSFHSPTKSPGRSIAAGDWEGSPRKRFRAMSLSPRYLSPTVSHSGIAFDEEYVMGCSICGTKAIENASWTHHASPPTIRPSNRPELVDMDGHNSGAYSTILSCRLHRAYGNMSDFVSMREIKLLDGRKMPESVGQLAVQTETGEAPTAQTTVMREIFPAPAVPLTPLNYEDANSLKESVFYNPLAEKIVREEERLRVVTRRAEYANRVKGFTRVVEATKVKGEGWEESAEDGVKTERVAVDPASDSACVAGWSEGEKSSEEQKREPVRVKAPSSFRSAQRVTAAREAGSESSEASARSTNSELAKKKLEEIKMTVRQRREERKTRELRAAERPSAMKDRRETSANPSEEAKDTSKPAGRGETQPQPSVVPSKPSSAQAPVLRGERKSAITEPAPAHLTAEGTVTSRLEASDEEEFAPLPVMAAPERPPQLLEDDILCTEDREAISPISEVDTSSLAKPNEGLSSLFFPSTEEGIRHESEMFGEEEVNIGDLQPSVVTIEKPSPRFQTVVPATFSAKREKVQIPILKPVQAQEDGKEAMVSSARRRTEDSSRSELQSGRDSPKPFLSPRISSPPPIIRVTAKEKTGGKREKERAKVQASDSEDADWEVEGGEEMSEGERLDGRGTSGTKKGRPGEDQQAREDRAGSETDVEIRIKASTEERTAQRESRGASVAESGGLGSEERRFVAELRSIPSTKAGRAGLEERLRSRTVAEILERTETVERRLGGDSRDLTGNCSGAEERRCVGERRGSPWVEARRPSAEEGRWAVEGRTRSRTEAGGNLAGGDQSFKGECLERQSVSRTRYERRDAADRGKSSPEADQMLFETWERAISEERGIPASRIRTESQSFMGFNKEASESGSQNVDESEFPADRRVSLYRESELTEATPGSAIRVEDQSRLSDTQSSFSVRGRVSGGCDSFQARASTEVAEGRTLKSTSVQQARRKLASTHSIDSVKPAKVSEVASFYKLQWNAAVRIQRHVRRFIARRSRNKATQTNPMGNLSLEVRHKQEVIRLLADERILSGLRLLGGFADYLQIRGLRDL